MKRKIVQQGPSTLMVSLPSKWVKQNHIKKGDEINIELKEEGLVLSCTTVKQEPKSVSFDVTGMDRGSLFYCLRGAYVTGHDEIIINFRKPFAFDYRKKMKESVSELIALEVSRLHGMEIFSQSHDKCVLRSISSESASEFNNMYRRAFLIFIDSLKEFTQAYANKDLESLKLMDSRHNLISKFTYYCQRIICKGQGPDFKKSKVLFASLNYVDMATDALKYCARICVNKKYSPSKRMVESLNDITALFERFVDLDRSFSFAKLSALAGDRVKVHESLTGHHCKSSDTDMVDYLFSAMEYLRFMIFARVVLYFAEK